MLKTAVIEGSGITPSTANEVFNVVTFSSHETNNTDATSNSASSEIDLLHLTGSVSLSALLLNFVRTKISAEYLPWTVFTSGKRVLFKQFLRI